jgi:hypothetical protein
MLIGNVNSQNKRYLCCENPTQFMKLVGGVFFNLKFVGWHVVNVFGRDSKFILLSVVYLF